MQSIKIKLFCLFVLLCQAVPCYSYTDSIHEIKNTEASKLIKLKTSEGDITISLFTDKAPETVKNFIYYAKNGSYKGTIFHRVISNFMIQGGGHLPDMSQISAIDPIVNESSNNLGNKKGTVAMARTSDPHSATSQFFINLIDNNFLDKNNAPDNFGYCVFGEVVEGMEVVERIGTTDTGTKLGFSDVPLKNIIIEDVEIIEE